MIKKAIKAIKNIFVPPIEYRNFEDDIECAIDENIVECKEMDEGTTLYWSSCSSNSCLMIGWFFMMVVLHNH